MDRRLRILFLSRWYPNRYDPMPGLFIQRQAEAIAPLCDVAVIYIHPDPKGPEEPEADFKEENGVRVLRVYFRSKEGDSLFVKAKNFREYERAYLKAYLSIREFKPDIVHAHILTRTAWIGRKIASMAKAQLVLSEHWSRYFPENNTYQGWFRRLITERVIRQSDALTAVSGILLEAMNKNGLHHPLTRIIPNVVELPPGIQPSGLAGRERKTFVHISCFEDRSKNITGFLNAVKALLDRRKDFNCLMIGTGPDWLDMKEYAGFLRIPESVVSFAGLKTGREFWELLSAADFSVLSSRYETFGTVVIESLACGVPVVATRVGIAPEVINTENGLLVKPADDVALTAALNDMLDSCRSFDRENVCKTVGDRFSPVCVGKELLNLYYTLCPAVMESVPQ